MRKKMKFQVEGEVQEKVEIFERVWCYLGNVILCVWSFKCICRVVEGGIGRVRRGGL